MLRKVRLTKINGESIKITIDLPGNVLAPPKFLQFRNELYQYNGSGLGQETVNFYRQFENFKIVQDIDWTD